MTESLERWARLEPERCRSSPEGDPAPGPHVLAAGTWWSSGQFPGITPALILAAVIEAIEARGLTWRVETDEGWPNPLEGYHAEIDWLSGSVWRHQACGGTPAAALLSAYLEALDHQASVDEYGGTR